MAVHLSIGRIPSILLLALLAVAAGTALYQSRSGPETAPASQVTASQVPASQVPASQVTDTGPLASPTAGTKSAELLPAAEPQRSLSQRSPEVRKPARSTLRARNLAPIPGQAPRAAKARVLLMALFAVAARTAQIQPRSEPETAPESQTPEPQIMDAIAGLTTEPQHLPPQNSPAQSSPAQSSPAQSSPEVRDPAPSTLHAKNPAPIPRRPLRTAKAGGIAASRAAELFQSGAKIKIKKDANLYITSRNIPKNDRFLSAYNVDRVRTRLGEAAAMPGLLGVADQTNLAQDPAGRNAQTYSLADAMRDVIWRRNTAARLKSLTLSQNACAGGIGARTPTIGLFAGC